VRPPRGPDHHDDATRSCGSDCSIGVAATDSSRVDHGSSRHRSGGRHHVRSTAEHRPSSRAAASGIVRAPHSHIVDHNWCPDNNGGLDYDRASGHNCSPNHHERHRSAEHDDSAYDDNRGTVADHNIYAARHDDHDSERADHAQRRAAQRLGST
jgi:hypothetical protein